MLDVTGRSRSRRTIGSAAVAVLLGAACSGGGGSTSSAPEPTPAVASETEAEAAPSPEPVEEAPTVSVTSLPGPTADEGIAASDAGASEPPQTVLTGSSFLLPSGNIWCALFDFGSGSYLECGIGSHLQPPPADECELDWTGIALGASGPAEPVCAGDTFRSEIDESAVLEYGWTWTGEGITCASTETGLRCENPNGRRFHLSRATWSVA